MIRSSLSITVLAAAAAAGLFTTPGLAAQSTTPSTTPATATTAERQVAVESDVGQDDAVHVRRLVNEEAVHRDRVARLGRLRALAEQNNMRERLAELDRLDRLEGERFEARTLAARSHMSDRALRQTDDFIHRGGVIKVRRANAAADNDAQRAVRTGNSAGTERSLPQRKAASSTRSTSRPQATRAGSSSSGRASAGGRSPR